MSRSYKKHPCAGWACGKGQKKFRTQENKAKRRKVRTNLLYIKDNRQIMSKKGKKIDTVLGYVDSIDIPSRYEMPAEKEYGNEWSSPRDGKQWFDPKEWPKGMRK